MSSTSVSSPTDLNSMTQTMCVAVKRLNTAGKPKGVRKFFFVECVYSVPEQHELPLHVFTGLSVSMHPAQF